jgi:uncharacterized protein YeeX (DUF496 family)
LQCKSNVATIYAAADLCGVLEVIDMLERETKLAVGCEDKKRQVQQYEIRKTLLTSFVGDIRVQILWERSNNN